MDISVQSNSDAFLVAVPLVVVLIAAMFRLDELVARPSKMPEPGRQLCRWDKNGVPISTDPAGSVYVIARRKHAERAINK
jgi:hypothetical protein